MLLDWQKETTPVLYGGGAVKVLDIKNNSAGEMLFGMHWHERMELLYVTGGELSVSFGDGGTEAVAGELVIIPPGRPHRGAAVGVPLSYYAVMFDPSFFCGGIPSVAPFWDGLMDKSAEFEPKTRNAEIISSVGALVAEYFGGAFAGELAVTAEVCRLTALLYRFCLVSASRPSGADLRFREIISFVDENYRSDISCASLSRRFGYDEAYFSRRFKEITGLSPTVYIRVLRLEYAQKLLKRGSSVGEAARESGFSDSGYFSRCFKKQFSLTPAEYILKG